MKICVGNVLMSMMSVAAVVFAFTSPASAGNCCGGSMHFILGVQEAKAVSVFLGANGMEVQVYTDPIPPENSFTYYLCLCHCDTPNGTGSECQLTERRSEVHFDNSIDPGCIFSMGPPIDCHCSQQGCHHGTP